MATMRALRLTREAATAAPTLSLVTLPKPVLQPTDTNHLLVQIRASAIQPSDVLNSLGSFPFTQFPRVPGRDFAGTVAAAPESLKHLVGTSVFGTSGPKYAFTEDGFHAEFALVHVDDLSPMPKNLTFTQAAVIGVPYTTAALTLTRAQAKKGETVLVLGANGSVGSAVVQLAKGLGAVVLKASRGVATDDIDTAKDPELSKVKELTNGRGVDVVIDTVGVPALTAAAIKALALHGRIAWIAAPRAGSKEIVLDIFETYRQEKSLIGCNSLTYSAEYMAKELAGMKEGFESGVLKAEDGQWKKVKLGQEALDAFQALREKKTRDKFVVTID